MLDSKGWGLGGPGEPPKGQAKHSFIPTVGPRDTDLEGASRSCLGWRPVRKRVTVWEPLGGGELASYVDRRPRAVGKGLAAQLSDPQLSGSVPVHPVTSRAVSCTVGQMATISVPGSVRKRQQWVVSSSWGSFLSFFVLVPRPQHSPPRSLSQGLLICHGFPVCNSLLFFPSSLWCELPWVEQWHN